MKVKEIQNEKAYVREIIERMFYSASDKHKEELEKTLLQVLNSESKFIDYTC